MKPSKSTKIKTRENISVKNNGGQYHCVFLIFIENVENYFQKISSAPGDMYTVTPHKTLQYKNVIICFKRNSYKH